MWIFQIVAGVALIAVFVLYIVLFAARVFILQLLTILSPLAFLCLILPQTQKYWDEWLKHMVQWAFVGTFLLFSLMLGFSAGNALLPSPDVLPSPVYDLGAMLPILHVSKILPLLFVLVYFPPDYILAYEPHDAPARGGDDWHG